MASEQDDDEEFSSADDNEFAQGRQPAGRADDDFDQDFDDSASMPHGGGTADFRASAVINQPYDEAVELDAERAKKEAAGDTMRGRAGQRPSYPGSRFGGPTSRGPWA